MTDHLSPKQINAFRMRALTPARRAQVARHLTRCPSCLQLFRAIGKKGSIPAINLSAVRWLRGDHLDYEQLVAFVDHQMNAGVRELADLHLEACVRCRADVQDFLAHRAATSWELGLRYAPEKGGTAPGWLFGFRRWLAAHARPAHAVAAVAVILIATITWLFAHRTTNPTPPDSARLRVTDPSPTPSAIVPLPTAARSKPSPPDSSTPTDAKLSSRQATDPIIVLNDRGAQVRIGPSGRVTSFERLPADLRQAIKETVETAELKQPDVLAELRGVQGPLRGGADPLQAFRLLSPGRTVLEETRPVFRWEPLEGATGYRVLVGDSLNREAAASGPLPSSTTQWRLPTALKRGETYTWVVLATAGGREITAPPASAPEMKFKVLDAAKAKELDRLRRNTDSRLALGIFYARAGLLPEAELELRRLAEDNPDSRLAAALLRQVEAWR